MMQYSRDMKMEDLFAYWADGSVLYKDDEDKWLLCAIRQGEGDYIDLIPWEPNEDPYAEQSTVQMTKDVFFDTVVLHRPVINLSMYNGVLYRITWAPPPRNANKAIVEEQLRFIRLSPRLEFTAAFFAPLLKVQAACRDGIYAARSAKRPLLDPSQERLSGLTLLLQALNYKHLVPKAGILEAIRTVGRPVLVDNDSWIVATEGGTVSNSPHFELEYHVGEILICTIVFDSYTRRARLGSWASKEVLEFWLDSVYKYIHLLNYGEEYAPIDGR